MDNLKEATLQSELRFFSSRPAERLHSRRNGRNGGTAFRTGRANEYSHQFLQPFKRRKPEAVADHARPYSGGGKTDYSETTVEKRIFQNQSDA